MKNGLLLCSNHDTLFDNGYITIKKDGKIKLSKSIPDDMENEYKNLIIDTELYDDYYMDYHRKHVFKK